MNNQAAQTMPEPITASMCPSSDYAKGWNDCLAAMLAAAPAASGGDWVTALEARIAELESIAFAAKERLLCLHSMTGEKVDYDILGRINIALKGETSANTPVWTKDMIEDIKRKASALYDRINLPTTAASVSERARDE